MENNTAFFDKRREQHEHVLATACATARAGREEPTDYDHRDRPARRSDEFDYDHERDDDDDENRNADRYGRRMNGERKLSVTAITTTTHDNNIETFMIHDTARHSRFFDLQFFS